VSKSAKKATSKGRQVEIAPPKKAKAAFKGRVASTALSEDKKKASTSGSKGKTANTLAKGHAKSIAEGNDAETKAETGMLAFFILLRLWLSCIVGLTSLIVVEKEGLIRSSKRRPKPTMKVTGKDPLSPTIRKDPKASSSKPQTTDAEPEDDEEEEDPSTIHSAFLY